MSCIPKVENQRTLAGFRHCEDSPAGGDEAIPLEVPQDRHARA